MRGTNDEARMMNHENHPPGCTNHSSFVIRHFGITLLLLTLCTTTRAQSPLTRLSPTPTPPPSSTTATTAAPTATPAEEETIIPTFETQKLARTYILDVPAPRGQITDRNGA